MAQITDKIREEVKEIVFDFFAEECEIEIDEISESSNIIGDLDGDSLMFLELIEIFKKKYNLNIELKTIGKYAVKNPVQTIGELIDMQLLIIEHENEIINYGVPICSDAIHSAIISTRSVFSEVDLSNED